MRRVAVQAGEQRDFDALEHLARLVELVLEQRRERSDEAIRQQNTEERTDQRGGDELAELRRWQADRLHRMNDAHDRGDDTEGGQRIAHLGDRADRNLALVVMRLDLHVHEIFDLERVEIAADHEPQIVGQELHPMVIRQDARILRKDRALLRIVDVRFDRHQAFFAHLREDVVQQREQLQKKRLVVLGALEHVRQRLQGALDDLARVRHEKSTGRRAEDHDQFDRLHERTEMAACEGESSEHRRQNDDVADQYEHGSPVCLFSSIEKPGRRLTRR